MRIKCKYSKDSQRFQHPTSCTNQNSGEHMDRQICLKCYISARNILAERSLNFEVGAAERSRSDWFCVGRMSSKWSEYVSWDLSDCDTRVQTLLTRLMSHPSFSFISSLETSQTDLLSFPWIAVWPETEKLSIPRKGRGFAMLPLNRGGRRRV